MLSLSRELHCPQKKNGSSSDFSLLGSASVATGPAPLLDDRFGPGRSARAALRPACHYVVIKCGKRLVLHACLEPRLIILHCPIMQHNQGGDPLKKPRTCSNKPNHIGSSCKRRSIRRFPSEATIGPGLVRHAARRALAGATPNALPSWIGLLRQRLRVRAAPRGQLAKISQTDPVSGCATRPRPCDIRSDRHPGLESQQCNL